jgi:hypothetical protein
MTTLVKIHKRTCPELHPDQPFRQATYQEQLEDLAARATNGFNDVESKSWKAAVASSAFETLRSKSLQTYEEGKVDVRLRI